MADWFYAARVGQGDNPQVFTVGTATAGLPGAADIELHVNNTNVTQVRQVVIFLEALKQFLIAKGLGTATGQGVDLPIL
jgi:hypothetical protein